MKKETDPFVFVGDVFNVSDETKRQCFCESSIVREFGQSHGAFHVLVWFQKVVDVVAVFIAVPQMESFFQNVFG